MTKRTDRSKTLQFTARVHKQHSSLVITFPKKLAEELHVIKGDMLLFEVEPGDVAAVVGKMTLRGSESGTDRAG